MKANKLSFVIIGVIHAFIFLSLFTGCSASKKSQREEKHILKHVKHHGAKETAVVIAKHFPEVMKPVLVKFDSLIPVPFEVKVPEYIKDTIVKTNSNCPDLYYADSKIEIKAKTLDGILKLTYKLIEGKIKGNTSTHVSVDIPCPPCPQSAVIDQLVKENNLLKERSKHKSFFERLQSIWFWISVCLLSIWVVKKIYLR